MPTTKQKGEAFLRKMEQAENEALKLLEIDRKDVTVSIRVAVYDAVTYNNHEDED